MESVLPLAPSKDCPGTAPSNARGYTTLLPGSQLGRPFRAAGECSDCTRTGTPPNPRRGRRPRSPSRRRRRPRRRPAQSSSARAHPGGTITWSSMTATDAAVAFDERERAQIGNRRCRLPPRARAPRDTCDALRREAARHSDRRRAPPDRRRCAGSRRAARQSIRSPSPLTDGTTTVSDGSVIACGLGSRPSAGPRRYPTASPTDHAVRKSTVAGSARRNVPHRLRADARATRQVRSGGSNGLAASRNQRRAPGSSTSRFLA